MGFGSCPEGASPRSALSRAAGRCRRGAVVVWTLMFAVLLVTALCVVVEIAHLYLARTELENALEAAALAGADYWGKNIADNSGARAVAQAYAAANTVDNLPVILDATPGSADVNLNASPSSNLILGAVSFDPVRAADRAYLFEHDTIPSCTVTETIVASIDISWTVQGSDTYGTANMFELEYWDFTPITPRTMPAPRITKITYGVAGTGLGGWGRFDVDTGTPPANEPFLGLPTPAGWGPFNGTGTVAVTFTPTNADGVTNVRYKTLEVVPTTPLLPGGVIRFGVDTDMMNPPPAPTTPVNTTDSGGAFYTSDFYMALEFEGDSAHQVILYGNGPGVKQATNQTFLNRGQAQQFSFEIVRPGNGSYGMRAQANIEVTPWLKTFLGIPIGPFRVAARTTARAGCNAETRLVRIAEDGWTTFPAPYPP